MREHPTMEQMLANAKEALAAAQARGAPEDVIAFWAEAARDCEFLLHKPAETPE